MFGVLPTRASVALLLLTLVVAGCGPGVVPPERRAAAEALGANADGWMAAGGEATVALAAGKWEEAAAAYERRISLYPGSGDGESAALLERVLRVDLYNLACARALAGRKVPALDALEDALRDGFGDIGFDHLGDDPDLDSLREEPRFRALRERLSWTPEVAFGGAPLGEGDPVPLLVILRGEGVPESVADVTPPGAGKRFAVAVPDPPYRVSPEVRAWTTTLDRGGRAARKAAFAVEEAERRGPLDRRRVVLLAEGEGTVALAWEILLRGPGPFTHAVLQGPVPAAFRLLDRGGADLGVDVTVVGEESAPPPPLAAGRAGSVEEALGRILE